MTHLRGTKRRGYTQRVDIGAYYTDGADVYEVLDVHDLGFRGVEVCPQPSPFRNEGGDCFACAFIAALRKLFPEREAPTFEDTDRWFEGRWAGTAGEEQDAGLRKGPMADVVGVLVCQFRDEREARAYADGFNAGTAKPAERKTPRYPPDTSPLAAILTRWRAERMSHPKEDV